MTFYQLIKLYAGPFVWHIMQIIKFAQIFGFVNTCIKLENIFGKRAL